MTTAWIGLGANLGDPETAFLRAAGALDRAAGVRVRRLSPAYLTVPHGPIEQPPYLNAVLEVDVVLEPEALLDVLHRIEAGEGRRRDGPRWGPRTLDLDLLLFGEETVAEPDLVVPHVRFAERRFVLQPLADLAPSIRPPGSDRSVADLLAACLDRSVLDGPWVLPRRVAARTIDHGGDLALAASGADPADLAVQAALGLAAVVIDRGRLRESERWDARVTLPASPERMSRGEWGEVLADALGEVIFRLDAEGRLPARATAVVGDGALRIAFFGQTIRGLDLPVEHSPKAITRHGLRCTRRRTADGGHRWTLRAVIDL